MIAIEAVRSKLSDAFPTTRFFVSRDWGGYRIRWVGGPAFEEIRAFADELQKGGVSIRCQRAE